jgi:DNA repair exonuclease SbcCD ATPase subunit
LDIIRSAGREALVVDHDKTVKDMAESVLLVEKKDGISLIESTTPP